MDELRASRDRLLQLLHPASTVMDFNIAAVLWFAAQGDGVIFESNSRPTGGATAHCAGHQRPVSGYSTPVISEFCRYAVTSPADGIPAAQFAELLPHNGTYTKYHSDCRVLLSGLGADELLGGYTRHRVTFSRGDRGTTGGAHAHGHSRALRLAALQCELDMDLGRLWRRNLGNGRCSHHSWPEQASSQGEMTALSETQDAKHAIHSWIEMS